MLEINVGFEIGQDVTVTKNIEIQIVNNSFSIEEKVAFLKRPEIYPHVANKVDTKETHMSWIFLVNDFVYKLKKPVKYQYLDHRSLESRFRDCRREIRLNKKLAEEIYIGLVPLTKTQEGKLRLSGNGEVIEWLIKMKRIPEKKMLDYAISHRTINEEGLEQIASLLTDFYMEEPAISISEKEYRIKLLKEITVTYKALIQPQYKLSRPLIEKITNKLFSFLDSHHSTFNERVEQRKIIEAHGDLRPEHVCLTAKPVIIDRLEFNRNLRILDIAEELSYFSMECEMMGNSLPGKIFFEVYRKQTFDEIDPLLILFYKTKRACLRAYLVARHITEQNYKGDDEWIAKANKYLALALEYSNGL